MAVVKVPPRLRVLNNEPTPPQEEAKPKKKSASKRKGVRKIDDTTEFDYDNLNRTELLTMARMANIPGTSPAVSREMLINALVNLQEIDILNPVDKIKIDLIDWMKKYWNKIRMQTPENVFDLLERSDFQVAFFYLKNKDQMT